MDLLTIQVQKSIVVSLFNIVMIVFVICIIDIFETISTTIAMKNFIWLKPKECENVIDKEMPKILEVDSATTSLGALIGMTTVFYLCGVKYRSCRGS